VQRRRLLRRIGTGLATGTVAATAGCTGGGDGGGDADGSGEDGGGTGSDGAGSADAAGGAGDDSGAEGSDGTGGGTGSGGTDVGQESRGSVLEHEIDGIEIVGWESELAGGSEGEGEERLEITLAVENAGTETTDATEYHYRANVYEDNGDEIDVMDNRNAAGVTTDTEIDPGETTVVYVVPSVANPRDVATYELSVTCASLSDGIYCPD